MQKPAERTGVAIRKRSKVPGVMITQYVEELPPEKTTPDFTRKPIALTIQEGKLAIFKAVVNGDPAPDVTWGRNKGELSDSGKYKTRFDERNQEYILEMPNVSSEQADTYKCLAINPFGKAVCTATLNVIEVGFKKRAPAPKNDPEDFRKMLKKTVVTRKQKQWKEGEIDPRFWEVLLSANKIDYEHICLKYGVTDFRWMLKILNQMKMERDAEQSKYVERIQRMKQIEVKTDGTAKFELDMKLKDPSSKISLFKDGKMLDYGVGNDDSKKHNMQKLDETFLFSIKDLGPEDAGLYQVDVEEANVFSTALSLPDVEFDSTLKDTTVVQGQDAMFKCALSAPVPKITWCANDVSFEHGDKYDVTVSENKQVHKLTVKNCKPEDKGVYSAIVGLKSSHGTLVVDEDPNAGGKGDDAYERAKCLAEEQARLQREKEEAERRAQAEKEEVNRRRAQAERDDAERRAEAERDEAARRRAQAETDEAVRRAEAEGDEAARRRDQMEREEAARKALVEREEPARRAQAERDEAAGRGRAEQIEAERRAQLERDEAARRAQEERDEAARRKAHDERDEAARRTKEERDEAARRKAQDERDEAARRAQEERDEAARRKAHDERDEAARRAQEERDEAARRKAQDERDEAARRAQEERDEAARRKAQDERDEAARRAQEERDEAARRKAQDERDEAARRAQEERDEAARRKAQDERDEAARRAQEERDEAARRKAQDERDEAARRAQEERDEAARRKAQDERDEAARRAQEERDEAARRKSQDERDEAARRAQEERDEAARRKAQDERDEAARRAQEERDEAARRKAQDERDEAARRAQEERDEAARRKAQDERDEAARRAQEERDEAARRKAQDERDEAARRAQEERDEAARRKAQDERDEAARRAQEERDEAARRKAQDERDEAARRAQEERDEAARRKAQEERDEAVRRAQEEQEEVATKAAMAKENLADGIIKDDKRDRSDVNVSDGDETDKKRKIRPKVGELVPYTITDPGVHFLSGLSNTKVNVGESAELSCKLSSEDSAGMWYKDGKKLESKDGITVVKDGPHHKLIISTCQDKDSGTYKFEAEGRKSQATLTIEDPPRIDAEALGKFSEPVIVKAGENASFKVHFSGKDPIKIQWFQEDEELLEGRGVKIERSSTHSRLRLAKCQRRDTGEIKIKIRNEFDSVAATSQLIVLDKPMAPQGPVEIIESSLTAIEFKWKPPKDDGGCQVTEYNLERQQLGRNTWIKIGDIPAQSSYRDTDIDCGRKYCYRIRAKNWEGLSDALTTDDMAAGSLAFPGPPGPPKIVSAYKDCINLKWLAPSNTGGSITGYNVEKRKKGSNFWSQVNPKDEPIRDNKFPVKDIIEGSEYEFRVTAMNTCGPGEPSVPSECVFARDPKKPPGKVKDIKLTASSYTTLSLSWAKPTVVRGVEDEAKEYFLEIRPTDQLEWSRCHTNAVIQTSFTVMGLKSMATYWVRVTATNEGGEGLPQALDNYITAMPPPVKPKFTDSKMKNFMVVKAGNTVRVSVSFEACPIPDITWLKDGFPVAKHVTIIDLEKVSQLFIHTSELSDTGIYTVTVKNVVGQDTFTIEIRVTDDPRPPGPVELEQNVKGTVTVTWAPSPDEKRDDRLHYMVMKRDSIKQTWRTVVDRLFNNKFTVVNILPGREYNFRVFAKNDISISEPSVSPVWGTTKKREKFTCDLPVSKTLDLQAAPKFIVPLKRHVAPPGYECYMSCAVIGNPTPHVTWYRNNASLNTNPNYYITNVCGVCSMLILMVGPKDMGEYMVVADSPLGRAECSTTLTVRE